MQPRYNPQMMAPIERKQALARMNPHTAPIASNNIFGDQMQKNNEAFMMARQRGEDGAPMIQKARQLAPLNFLENTVGMEPEQREAILGMPMPRADTGEGRFARQPSQPPDPFGGGYKPRGKGDPYGPLPPRPKGFAMGGTVTKPALTTPFADEENAEMTRRVQGWGWGPKGFAMGGTVTKPALTTPFADEENAEMTRRVQGWGPKGFAMGGTVGALPTPDELTAEMGGKPWSWTHSGPSQFSPFKDMMPKLGRRTNQMAEGGTIDGPGGPTDDMVPAIVDGVDPVWLSDGERVQKASTRDWLGEKFFVDLDKKADKERAEYEATQGGKPKSVMPMPMPESGGAPGYADGGTIERIANAATRARLREQDAGLSPDPYGPSLTDSPVFQPAPRQTGQQPANVFASPMPEMQPVARTAPSLMPMPPELPTQDEMRARGQAARAQLEAQRADPMPIPMKPAPLTMTEQERMFTPARPARTPVADPAFEAALTGLSGMEKRKARAALTLEEAAFARDQGRADAAARVAEARAQQNREQDFAEWQQKQVIGDQFQQAAENRRIGTTAALNAADDQQKQAAAAAAAEANRRFSPVLDDAGNPIPGRMMNPQGQQLNTEPPRAEGIRMEPVPGMPGRVLPMMGGSRVPGMPMMQANTAPGPFREGLGRTTFTPVQETEAAKAPTVRKTAPRKGFSAEAPEWEYASLSDGSTRPITIDNPLPTQTKERFQHQYGRAPQTEQEWTEAWYLTTGQPMPAASGNPASASASTAPATRAKIKSITPVS